MMYSYPYLVIFLQRKYLAKSFYLGPGHSDHEWVNDFQGMVLFSASVNVWEVLGCH